MTPSAKYVTRGGLKSEGALHDFRIIPERFTRLDLGACTGGFTDCMLRHAARLASAVAVGRGLMAMRSLRDRRVTSIERSSARLFDWSMGHRQSDLVVVSVSCISPTVLVGQPSSRLVPVLGQLIALLKPQFEAVCGALGGGGTVRVEAARKRAVAAVFKVTARVGAACAGVVLSPMSGGDAHVGYLALFTSKKSPHIEAKVCPSAWSSLPASTGPRFLLLQVRNAG